MKILTIIITWLGIIFRKLKPFNKKYVFPVIDLMEIIRDAIKTDSVKWLVELTKSDWDDKLRDKMIEKLSTSIIYLKVSSSCLDKDNAQDVIDCFIEHLKTMQPHLRDAVIQKVAAVMVRKSMASGKIKQYEADLAVQLAYGTNKHYKGLETA